MITYVNTVLVSNIAASNVVVGKLDNPATLNTPSANAGKFFIQDLSEGADAETSLTSATAATADKIRVGIVTKKNTSKVDYKTGAVTYVPVVKWSHVINKDGIKSFTFHKYAEDTEDTVVIDFTSLDADILNKFNDGGKRLIIRITYKDMPHRFRKWTESYEYVTKSGDTVQSIANNVANMINKDYKRARVTAVSDGTSKVTLTAMPYDDDDKVDSISWYNKVRFVVNVYYTDPTAAAFASRNKYFPTGVTVNKTVMGKTYQASAKLVRDRESQAMGYEGILNRGQGTWPVIQPDMQTSLEGKYDMLTLEFENMYRTADDLQRRTKNALEVYAPEASLCATETIDPSTGITSAITGAGLTLILKSFIEQKDAAGV